MIENCGTCHYGLAMESAGTAYPLAEMRCRRFPPDSVVTIRGSFAAVAGGSTRAGDIQSRVGSHYPETYAEGWCGEWKAKKTNEETT